jgi:hypothetical protein
MTVDMVVVDIHPYVELYVYISLKDVRMAIVDDCIVALPNLYVF